MTTIGIEDIGDVRFAERDKPFHLVDVNLTHCFTILITILVWPVHVNVHDVLRDHLLARESVQIPRNLKSAYSVALLIMLVLHDEDHIETRQDSSLEVDIL